MKELENLTQDQQEITAAHEKKEVLMGSYTQQAGHTLFQCHKTTGEVEICKFENATIDLTTGKKTNKKLIYNPDYMYASALNKKNAIRKFEKMLMQELQQS